MLIHHLNCRKSAGQSCLDRFWTYSCINWRRTEPYIRAWAEKYKDQGLIVIGVHSPEFEFEKDVSNVRWALKDMHIEYPVAVDSKLAIWRAFRNDYWPALYFIDAAGTFAAISSARALTTNRRNSSNNC